MAHNWLDLMVKDETYREHIDVKKLRGKSIKLEGPVDLDLVLWLLKENIMPKVIAPQAG